ncbi:hypothetical protein ElyMa_002098100 [Elysia marginata]|uniref:Secreted protein n=1 Tax=Elysia marginata TaxID=1093978 RepID=A0AAV4FE82_9GAST|nr:hypothetical protein ElyMa_002098100 [Elysia marginata]
MTVLKWLYSRLSEPSTASQASNFTAIFIVWSRSRIGSFYLRETTALALTAAAVAVTAAAAVATRSPSVRAKNGMVITFKECQTRAP